MAGFRRRGRSWRRGIAWLGLPALLAGACTGGQNSPPATTTSSTVRPVRLTQGGDITVAAEHEPVCMDWISSCAGSAWGVWTVETNTMPRAYDFTSDNIYKPSILLTGEADVATSPTQVVTYHLNSKAVWSDGQPITSHDFKYTWDQIAHGQNIYDPAGYRAIASIDDSDPRTAVVTFTRSVADWKALFGGTYGVLPGHLLEGQDRNALMKDGYAWSGGPWTLAPNGWIRSKSITLIPNVNYWGKHPDLHSVTFDIIPDPAAARQAYQSGQVLAAYPEPQPGNAAYRSLPDTHVDAVNGLDFEGLWFNVASSPLTTKAFREAVAYSLDRDTIVNQLFGGFIPTAQAIQSVVTPAYLKNYTPAFARYHPDVTAVNQLMQGDGWTKGADGVWAKAGGPATFTVKYTAGNPRNQLLAQLIQSQLNVAGFVATPTPVDATVLFGHDLPNGTFSAGVWSQDWRLESAARPQSGQPPDNDPNLCRLFCSANIPTPANGLSGANVDRIDDPNLDRYFADLENNLDPDARVDDVSSGVAALADLVPVLPVAAVPDVIVVNSKKLAVEGGTFNHNLAYGPYSYLNQWYLR